MNEITDCIMGCSGRVGNGGEDELVVSRSSYQRVGTSAPLDDVVSCLPIQRFDAGVAEHKVSKG